ncbi:MAG: hypothetical protein AAGD14_10440 [Planctomycetota bacterium]
MEFSAKTRAYWVLVRSNGFPFGIVLGLFHRSIPMGLLAGLVGGMLLATVQIGSLSRDRFADVSWRDRIRRRRRGYVTYGQSMTELGRWLRTEFLERVRGEVLRDDGLQIVVQARRQSGWGHAWRIALQLLPGPDDTTHVVYTIERASRWPIGGGDCADSLHMEQALTSKASAAAR